MQPRDVVIIDAVRTPVGKAGGALKALHPSELLAVSLRGLMQRSGIDPGEVEQVVGGCVSQSGAQAANVARTGWLIADLPETAAATTVDSQCGSSQQALNIAVGLVASGAIDVAVACGVESMSLLPIGASVKAGPGRAFNREYFRRYEYISQFEAAERIGKAWHVTRGEADEFGLRSQERAAQAWERGYFDREVVPVDLRREDVDIVLRRDECPRASTIEGLASLQPLTEGGLHTAGTSSKVSDGSSAVLITSGARARELGVAPRARVVDHCLVGSDPVMMLTGPIPATDRLLRRTGMQMSDLDVVEINEAFASVVLAWADHTKADLERVNPNGGAIALGHPLGATGCKLIATALSELERRDGERALITMCCGGGLGTGTIIERVG